MQLNMSFRAPLGLAAIALAGSVSLSLSAPAQSQTVRGEQGISPFIINSSELFDLANLPPSDLPTVGKATLFKPSRANPTLFEIDSLFFPFQQGRQPFKIAPSPLPTISVTALGGNRIGVDFGCDDDRPGDAIVSTTFCGESKNAQILNATIEIKGAPALAISRSIPRHRGIQFRILAQDVPGQSCNPGFQQATTLFKPGDQSPLLDRIPSLPGVPPGFFPLCSDYGGLDDPLLLAVQEQFADGFVLFEGCGLYERRFSPRLLNTLKRLLLVNAKYDRGWSFCPKFPDA